MNVKMLVAGAGMCAAAAVGFAAPAEAEIATKSRGVGVCTSQVAIDTEGTIGEPSLGAAIRGLGATGELHELLKDLRNACGEPPGPGHL